MSDYDHIAVVPVSSRFPARRKAVAIVFIGVALVVGVVLAFVPDPPKHAHRAARIPAEDQAYFDALGPPINDSGPSMDALLDLRDAAQKNAAVLPTPDWQTKAKAACAALDGQGKALEGVAPVPADCLKTRGDAILTGQAMRLVAANFSKAANPKSPDLNGLEQATQKIDEVTRLSEIIADDANEVRAKYGVASTKSEPVKASQ